MNPKSANFKIDRAFLEKHFTKEYGKLLKSRAMFQFYVFLPFQFPINDYFLLKKEEGKNICFLFQDLDFNIQLPKEYIDSTLSDNLKGKITRVDLAYITSKDLLSFEDKSYYDYFKELFIELNNLIFSYQLSFSHLDTHRISVLNLINKASFYKVVDLNNWENKYENKFFFNEHIKVNRKTIDKEMVKSMLAYSVHFIKNFNPFFSSEETSLKSIKNFYDGDFIEVIINSQISVELFLSVIYLELLVYDGMDGEEAKEIVTDISYSTLVLSKFQEKLGGTWDKNLNDKPLGKYWNNTYGLRNRIVHGGYYPNYEDSKIALESALEFKNYVLKLLESKKKVYPKFINYLNLIYKNELTTYGSRVYNNVPKLDIKILK